MNETQQNHICNVLNQVNEFHTDHHGKMLDVRTNVDEYMKSSLPDFNAGNYAHLFHRRIEHIRSGLRQRVFRRHKLRLKDKFNVQIEKSKD